MIACVNNSFVAFLMVATAFAGALASVLPYLHIGVTDDAGFLIPWEAPAVFIGMNLFPPQAFNVSKAELAATLFIADENPRIGLVIADSLLLSR